jgi:ABC-2 type transport system permease protein
VLFSTACILSIGFVIASVVPTARFAQAAAALVLYPMLALSGLFVPVELLPRGLQVASSVLPLTYAVELQRGIWRGDGWLAHGGDVAALLLTGALALLVTSRVFRWE